MFNSQDQLNVLQPVRFARVIAFIILLLGAAGSVGLMLHVGHKNKSAILLIFFTTWVLSPFIALLIANIVSANWPIRAHVTLYGMMLIITLGSLLAYTGTFNSKFTKPAFPFLVTPFICWVVIAITIAIAWRMSLRHSKKKDKRAEPRGIIK